MLLLPQLPQRYAFFYLPLEMYRCYSVYDSGDAIINAL